MIDLAINFVVGVKPNELEENHAYYKRGKERFENMRDAALAVAVVALAIALVSAVLFLCPPVAGAAGLALLLGSSACQATAITASFVGLLSCSVAILSHFCTRRLNRSMSLGVMVD